MPVPQKFCHSVWSLIVQNSEYSFFQLAEPRKPYVFFDRLEQVDPSTGVMKEPKEYPGHRFKYNPITDNGIRGSCESYEARQVVTREELAAMSFQDVENRYRIGRFINWYSRSAIYMVNFQMAQHVCYCSLAENARIVHH